LPGIFTRGIGGEHLTVCLLTHMGGTSDFFLKATSLTGKVGLRELLLPSIVGSQSALFLSRQRKNGGEILLALGEECEPKSLAVGPRQHPQLLRDWRASTRQPSLKDTYISKGQWSPVSREYRGRIPLEVLSTGDFCSGFEGGRECSEREGGEGYSSLGKPPGREGAVVKPESTFLVSPERSLRRRKAGKDPSS